MIPNPWVLLGVLLGFIGAATGGYFKGRSDEAAHWQIEVAKQAEAAKKREDQLQKEADENSSKFNAEKDAINARLANALERLRKRPERLPEAAEPSCQGATGRELSAPDAGFLEREAARADQLRAGLAACYQHLDSLTSP